MTSASPYAAIAEYLIRLRDSLTCVLDQVHLPFSSRLHSDSDEPYVVMLNDGSPQPLPSSLVRGLAVLVGEYVRPRRAGAGYVVEITDYSYLLGVRRRDVFRELLAWQWDQRGVSPVDFLHLYVSVASDVVLGGLSRLHIPTNQVFIQDVLEFTITELGVEPRRENWREILDTSR